MNLIRQGLCDELWNDQKMLVLSSVFKKNDYDAVDLNITHK